MLIFKVFKKDFYKKEYLKVEKHKILVFVLFLSLSFSLLITPLSVFKTFNVFSKVVKGIEKAEGFKISYSKKKGLSFNLDDPLVIKISNLDLVFDENAKFNGYKSESEVVIFRKYGYMHFRKGNLINQGEYKDLFVSDFVITKKDILNIFYGFGFYKFILVLFSFILFSNVFIFLLNGFSLALLFSSILFGFYVLMGQKEKFAVIFRKSVFLMPFVFLGLLINLLFKSFYFMDVFLLGLSYFYFSYQKKN